MTSPIGGGSEHVSRYKAVAEFDNLVRAAQKAKRALKDLREEEAKLNSESIAGDQKVAQSKQNRARIEESAAKSAKTAVEDLNKGDSAGKAGESAGTSYTKGVKKGIDKSSRDQNFLTSATNGLLQAMANAGDKSGLEFVKSSSRRIERESPAFSRAFSRAVKTIQDQAGSAGLDTGNRYVMGFASKIRDLNNILVTLGRDKLNLDVGIDDAKQSIDALEFELTDLAHKTELPQVRIDTNRALTNLRAIQKLFKDEVAEDIVKESERIRKELEKVDKLPSGKAFKFWALTALSDMSKVFEEAEKGTSTFERLRLAANGGGGGNNFLRTFISGFDDFSESSSNLLQRLSRVSGELYRMPGLIAVLVSAIPALVAGLGALGGGALGLSSGLGAALGVIVALPSAGLALATTVATLSSTFGGFAEVLKTAQQARMEELEAQEMQRLGTEKALTAQQKYNLALSDMGPATAKVTEAVVEFAEKWAESQKVVGENFFEQIVGSTERLNAIIPITENLLGKSATAVGKIADAGIKMITSGPWKKDFQVIAKDNATFIENMGFAALSLAEAFKNIMVAAGPFNSWLTRGIRNAADAFADWSATARDNGAIGDFLGETRESLESLWQILKNLGSVTNSFFQSTVDEGQRYLRTLEDITGHWADVAEAQEQANSPLRQWMVQIRPVLASLGALIGDLSRGIAGLATNQNSISQMIGLLDSLRKDVLPPILRILQELNDSGIAIVVTEALGDLLNAIATFLESGATTALSVFVTVLANFAELIFNIASLPGISDVLGAVASGLAAIAAVSIVARFVGLFKLWEFFTWMVRNKGNLSGAFSDAARGVAGLPTQGQTALPTSVPSSIGGIGSELTNDTEKQINKTGDAAQKAAPKVSVFSRAVAGIGSAGASAGRGLGGFADFLGGPWGIALAGAAVAIGVVVNDMQKQKQAAEDTKNAWLALADAYGQLQEGDTSGVEALARTDEKFRTIADGAKFYGITLADLSGALNGNEQASARVNAALDAQEEAYRANDVSGNANRQTAHLNMLGLRDFRNELNNTANAQRESNKLTDTSTGLNKTYAERLAGMTQEQVDAAVAINNAESKARILSGALDILTSSTADASQRARALSDIIKTETSEMERANEATENWNARILDLKDALKDNGNTLSIHTREGLRNRDALEDAAKATRDLYLEDIAAGVPMDKATERHRKRTEQLIKEAGKSKETKDEARRLVDMYGSIPKDVKTAFSTSGYTKVYEELQKAKFLQTALQKGISVDDAESIVNKDLAEARRGSGGRGDGYGIQSFATGGAVWGAGSKTSDSIRAWLSNGEFVQPADAVEHYGMPLMEALRTKSLDKTVVQEALPSKNVSTYATGGPAHSANCASCASGGHKFASGGSVRWPASVNVSGTKIDKDWIQQGVGLGNGSGGGGWQWQMNVLRNAFPGLPLISGFRPGSRTLSGNRSYHSLGRAVDLPPRRDVAQWIRSNYGSKTKELITPYNDLNIWNGKPHRYTGAVWNQHNFAGGNAHDHWAFNQGGMVDLMKMMNMNNLTPSQTSSLPSTPRSLSPAASSVVNNSSDNTRTFGDVIINNPAPERAGDSVRDALYRTTLLY